MLNQDYTNPSINSNKEMFQKLSQIKAAPNKTYLSASYSTNPANDTFYYNGEEQIKKENKKKKHKILTLAFAGISALSVIGGITFALIKNKLTAQEAIEQIGKSKVAQQAKPYAEKFISFCTNIDALKNDFWTQISQKLKITKFDDTIRHGYENLSSFENQQRYDKCYSRLSPFSKQLGCKELPSNYKDWFNSMSDEVGKNVNKRRISEVLFEGFKKQPEDKGVLDRLKRGFSTFWHNSTESIIADDNISDVYTKYTQGLTKENLPSGIKLSDDLYSSNPAKREIAEKALKSDILKKLEKNQDEFFGESAIMNKELYKKAISNTSKKAFDKNITNNEEVKGIYFDLLSDEIATSLTEMNRILTKGAKTTIEKQRDLHLGNASVDVLGMVTSAGLLGAAAATSDTKEERKNIILDLGVPLLSSMAFSFLGGIKNISGFASAAAGLAFGKAVSLTTEGIVNTVVKHKKKKETMNTIV